MGREGVRQDGQKQAQRLWYRHPGQLPCRLELLVITSDLVEINTLHQTTLRV